MHFMKVTIAPVTNRLQQHLNVASISLQYHVNKQEIERILTQERGPVEPIPHPELKRDIETQHDHLPRGDPSVAHSRGHHEGLHGGVGGGHVQSHHGHT